MSDRETVLRNLAAVRRGLDELSDEIDTAEGAMPADGRVADTGRENFRVVLKRLESIEELAGDAAGHLREVLKEVDR